jgi:hypothetical protein
MVSYACQAFFASIALNRVTVTNSGAVAVVSGGTSNTASGEHAAVSGGQNITQESGNGWSAGSEADEVVEGNFRSP